MRSTMRVLDLLQFEGGDVDDDMIVAEIVRHPAPALHVEHDLLDALSAADIHRLDGLLADVAFCLQPVALLEALHRDHKLLVIGEFAACPFIVAGRPAACADLRHARIGTAGLEGPPAR